MAGGEAEREGRGLTLQLENGPLAVRPVGANALAFLDDKYGLGEFYAVAHLEPVAIRAWMAEQPEERQAEINDGLDAMLNYCLMWGVDADPDEEDAETLEAMGFSTQNERVRRLYWLRLVRLTGAEQAAVMYAVRRLTFAPPVEEAE